MRVLAEAAQGMTGSTSVALSPEGRHVYVTTKGGMFLSPPKGVQLALLVELTLR